MSSKFHALPLARRGESFLLETGATDPAFILVDAGRELNPAHETTLAKTLAALSSSPSRIHRLVLSHEDADHCEGAPQFIQEWMGLGRSIAEAWLPALWLPAAGSAARDGWDISRIIKGAFEAAPEIDQLAAQMTDTEEQEENGSEENDSVEGRGQEGRDRLEALTRRFRQLGSEAAAAQRASLRLDELFRPVQEGEEDGHLVEPDWIPEDEGLDKPDFAQAVDCSFADPATGICLECAAMAVVGIDEMVSPHAELALKLASIAIQTHANIGPAVAACQVNAIRIRWFDYLLFASKMKARGGDAGFFTPVNAVELVPGRVKVSPRTMFLSLFLTRANRESLVFLRHAAGSEPAVLFTADSRLKAGRRPFSPPLGLPSTGRLLATAPHHGSKSNEAAYKVMNGWLGSDNPPILVQNGGHSVKAAATAFKAAPDHLCVLCIRSTAKPQLVALDAPSGKWHVPQRHAPCTCP